jgi:hypothetical protein
MTPETFKEISPLAPRMIWVEMRAVLGERNTDELTRERVYIKTANFAMEILLKFFLRR